MDREHSEFAYSLYILSGIALPSPCGGMRRRSRLKKLVMSANLLPNSRTRAQTGHRGHLHLLVPEKFPRGACASQCLLVVPLRLAFHEANSVPGTRLMMELSVARLVTSFYPGVAADYCGSSSLAMALE